MLEVFLSRIAFYIHLADLSSMVVFTILASIKVKEMKFVYICCQLYTLSSFLLHNRNYLTDSFVLLKSILSSSRLSHSHDSQSEEKDEVAYSIILFLKRFDLFFFSEKNVPNNRNLINKCSSIDLIS